MSVTELEHNPEKVKKALTRLEDGSVIANRRLIVHLSQRFIANGLAEVTDYVDTAPVLGIMLPDEAYTCFISMLRVKMFPSDMQEVSVNGQKYIAMEFFKGDTVFESVVSSVDPNMPYFYFMEFLNYAKIPWFMNYKAHSSLFDSALFELGKKVGATPQVMRMLSSIIYRDPDDIEKVYRGSKAMKEGRDPIIVGLNNPSMLINDSYSRYFGGYLDDNILANIIKPNDKVTEFDKLIRGILKDDE